MSCCLTILKRKESSTYYTPDATHEGGAEFFESVDDRTRPAQSDDKSRIIYRAERHDKAMTSKPFYGLTNVNAYRQKAKHSLLSD